jgi:hypothetical protein
LGVTADVNGIRPDRLSDDTVRGLFRELRPLLHSLVVIHYRFTEENARDAEADLQIWFERMARRSPRDAPPLRDALLVAACEYAKSTQLWRLDGKPSGDPKFDRFLGRDPREVAGEISRKTEGSPS